ncbi:hypothetical protein SSIN_0510 [Streptococcus sinensis]|uniref:Uncharacterized protein n=1 Tax=Streptococcus sinensis TaxID=176090 RepID=A0A0A0DG57_9STRE|nr:hypothetical protein SSIN_0510 [Streptococcus sinensis]
MFCSHFLILSRLMKPFLITPHYIIFHGVCDRTNSSSVSIKKT